MAAWRKMIENDRTVYSQGDTGFEKLVQPAGARVSTSKSAGNERQ